MEHRRIPSILALCVGLIVIPGFGSSRAGGADSAASAPSLATTLDLNVHETQAATLSDKTQVTVRLESVEEVRDQLRHAVRQARVRVSIDGRSLVLTSATYHLPVKFARVQVDCPITKGHVGNSSEGNPWGLVKDARLRIWPGDSPWIQPGTFRFPLRQRWFASHTQMANEPTYVDGGEIPGATNIYYHYGLDFGGAEELVDVVSATTARVISAGREKLPGADHEPAKPRYDVVYLQDDRGWYYRYSHLHTIDPAIKPGATVALGQKIGLLGKEGGSGGWSHLHFDITRRQPSGLWGIEDGYAFVWESYLQEQRPRIIAVARPHHFVAPGDDVLLDGSKSWSESGRITRHDWTFTDGSTASGRVVERRYSRPGEYSEILKVTDRRGRVDYDFAIVLVSDPSRPRELPPTIHPTFAPTTGIHPGDPVTFKVRTFRSTFGNETWDFGDGTPPVSVTSDGNVNSLAKDGYAVTEHRYAKPGRYLARVERANERGERAIGHLQVIVEPASQGR